MNIPILVPILVCTDHDASLIPIYPIHNDMAVLPLQEEAKDAAEVVVLNEDIPFFCMCEG
jgi:hypothetical protein